VALGCAAGAPVGFSLRTSPSPHDPLRDVAGHPPTRRV